VSVDGLLRLALAVSLAANVLAAVEVLHSIRFCFRRRVFWRVTRRRISEHGPEGGAVTGWVPRRRGIPGGFPRTAQLISGEAT
jgi:hypothetical protein